MTDRELLEAAAKAVNCGAWHPLTHDTPNGVWNPLTDDGDAFRLAHKLNLDVFFHEHGALVNTEDGYNRDEHGPDPLAAARRAIVRAAAAIGGA